MPGECVLGDAADGSTLDASVKWSLGLTRTGAMFALHGMQRQLAPESGGSSQRLLLAEEGAAAAAAFAAAMCGLDGAGAPCTDYPDACGDEGRCSRETMALLASRYDGVPGAAGGAPSGGAKRPRRGSDIGGPVALAGAYPAITEEQIDVSEPWVQGLGPRHAGTDARRVLEVHGQVRARRDRQSRRQARRGGAGPADREPPGQVAAVVVPPRPPPRHSPLKCGASDRKG